MHLVKSMINAYTLVIVVFYLYLLPRSFTTRHTIHPKRKNDVYKRRESDVQVDLLHVENPTYNSS